MKLRSSILFTIVLFCSFTLSNAQSLEQARRLSRNEQYEDAEKMFNAIIVSSPKDYKNYYYAGLNLIQAGDSMKALSLFNKGLEVAPKCLLNKVGQGHVKLKQGDLAGAKTLFGDAELSKNKVLAEIYREIGRAYLMNAETPLGKREKFANLADQNFAKANELKSDYENEVLWGDAWNIINPGDASNAILHYYNAKSLNDTDPVALLHEAHVYQRAKNYDAALDFTRQALKNDHEFAPAYRQIADIFGEARMTDSAIYYYKEYLKRNNNPSARRMYIQALYLAGAYEEAIAEGERLQKEKEFGNVWGIMAYSVAGMNNPNVELNQRGLEYFEKYENLYVKPMRRPLSAGESYRKGLLLFNTGAIEDAYGMFVTAFKDTAGSMLDWYDVAQNKYYKLMFYEETLEILRLKRIKTGKAELNDLYYSGNSLSGLGRYTEALDVYKQMVARDTNYISGYYLIAITQASVDSTDANGLAERAYLDWVARLNAAEKVKFKADIIGAYYFVANAARTRGDWNKTLAYYKKVQDITPEDEELQKTITQLEDYVKYLERQKKKK